MFEKTDARFVQIATCSLWSSHGNVLYALDENGEVWEFERDYWRKLPDRRLTTSESES